MWLLPGTGELLYYTASIAVLYGPESHVQRHYRGHTDDIGNTISIIIVLLEYTWSTFCQFDKSQLARYYSNFMAIKDWYISQLVFLKSILN